jgi:sucrose-6-phosphate hydrolase SacC (GH32 family)
MKNHFLCFFLFWLSVSNLYAQKEVYLFSYFVDNGQDGLHFAYSRDGLKWEALNGEKSFLTPTLGKDKLMRDPCIIQGPDGTFHMVFTTGWHDQIIGYASSKDLIHWSEQKDIPVMEHEITAKNSWAPEVFYNDQRKNFIIYWATTIPGRHSDVSDSESEKGLNHRIYAVTTKDFKTFTETKMFFNPQFSVIDATILKKDSWYYMFLKNENPKPAEKNIRVTKSKQAAGPYPIVVSAPITGNYWAEGPTAVTIDGYVYVYFDKYRDHQYGAVRSKDMINWEDISDKISFPKGTRHGTVFKVSVQVFNDLMAAQ